MKALNILFLVISLLIFNESSAAAASGNVYVTGRSGNTDVPWLQGASTDASTSKEIDFEVLDLNLDSLDLSNIKLTAKNLKVLENRLIDNQTIQKIKLSSIPNFDKDLVKNLEEILMNPNIVEIDLSSNKLDVVTMEILVDILKKKGNIRELDLSKMDIGAETIKILAKAMEVGLKLKKLNLDFNRLSSNGAKLLADMLYKNKSLRSLSLRNNDIRDKGTEYFAEALKKNRTLQVLDISYNSYFPDTQIFKFFIDTIRVNKSLRILRLIAGIDAQKNYEGKQEFFDAVKHSETLIGVAPFHYSLLDTLDENSKILDRKDRLLEFRQASVIRKDAILTLVSALDNKPKEVNRRLSNGIRHLNQKSTAAKRLIDRLGDINKIEEYIKLDINGNSLFEEDLRSDYAAGKSFLTTKELNDKVRPILISKGIIVHRDEELANSAASSSSSSLEN